MNSKRSSILTFTKSIFFRKNSLGNNFVWTLFGGLYFGACQWAIISIIAKLSDTSTVGIYALGLAVNAPIFLLTDLNLRTYQASDTSNAYSFGDYLGLRMITSVLAVIIVYLTAYIGNYRTEAILIIMAVAVYKSVESFGDIIYGLLQQQERMEWISKSLIIKGTISVITIGAIYFITGNLLLAILMMSFSSALIVVFYDRRRAKDMLRHIYSERKTTDISLSDFVYKEITPRFRLDILRRITWVVLPMGISAYLLSLSNNIPNYVIERILGESSLGIFAAIAYLSIVGLRIENSIIRVIIPRMSKYNAAAKFVDFRKLFYKVILLNLCIGITGILVSVVFGKPILKLLYTQEYAQYTNVLIMIMISVALKCINAPLLSNLIVTRKLKTIMLLDIIYLTSTFAVCIIFIPGMQLTGAGIAVVISSLVRLISYSIANILCVFKNDIIIGDIVGMKE